LDSDRATVILDAVLPNIPPGSLRARALLELLRTEREVEDAIVAEALENARGNAHLRTEILNYAAVLHEIHQGVATATETAQAAVREAERANDERLLAETLAYAGHLATLSDPGEQGVTLLARAEEIERRSTRIGAWNAPAHWIGVRLMWEDRLDEARELLKEQLRIADEERDVFSQGGLCFHLTQLETRAGAAQRALMFAGRAWEIDAGSRRAQGLAISLYARALAHANFGDEATARASAVEALAAFERLGDLFFTIHARSALAQLELSLDDPPAAIEALGDVRELRGRTQVGEPGIFPFDADEVEALVGAGGVEEADAFASDLLERGKTLGRARLVATGLRSRALVAAARDDLAAAEALLREALRAHQQLPVPLERGRTLLALGTVLRRAQRKSQARETLEQAAALFAAIRTPRWEQRARAEAARIGGRTAPRGLLTAMEEKIADLAAAGRTNAEIGDELHVSPRTVQWNLSKIYKKLGVRSRTELAAARLQPPT
jgi:DNA-binding CsgD family transcriptional regulator